MGSSPIAGSKSLTDLWIRKVFLLYFYNGCVIVIKNVPCEECEQCGEKFYTDEVAEQLEKMVDSAKKLMQEISVIDYSKVA
ncbi:MAG: type II toxin-antitoxin system MqsA family antitoxin [Roseburia sp.]